jgi:hypothetical protein
MSIKSIRAVLSRRINSALSRITYVGLLQTALPIVFVGGILYLGTIGAISDPKTPEENRQLSEIVQPYLALALQVVILVFAAVAILKIVWDVRKESIEYAQKIGATSQQDGELVEHPADTSDPEKLFQVSRKRLLDEAVRIDKISRRNLVIGILFSFIALATLVWPLVAQTVLGIEPVESGVTPWFALARYYLPRFAVGLLLQFVGFFFLRLYVANELDLKHNKNEVTNIEMRMMGLQLAKAAGDAASRKEVIKSLMSTERNFLIKRNEKSVSTEALSEYNDLKGLIEKLVSKIPGVGK